MKKITIIFLFIAIFFLKISAQNLINHSYPYTDGPDKNPMKGWNSGWWDNYNLASVGFQYISWKDFEPTDSTFDFNAVENIINRPGSAGRHLILRLYADWHGNQAVSAAGPDWLYNDFGVQRLQAPNGRYITDYNDPNYISQAIEAIEALAAHYENDPRIYTIQLGVLGYWGEWHTSGFNDNSFTIDLATKTQILDAYKNNFSNKKLMGRYPWAAPLALDSTIGFHNDFFKPNNGHSDQFNNRIFTDGKWLNGPIGGEAPPIDSVDRQQFMTALYETNTGVNMIETGHYSTMKVGNNERPCQSNPNSPACDGFMALHRKMGYNYQIESALFAENLFVSDSLYTELKIRNIGVAPMYYDWDVQVALLDQSNQVIKMLDVPYNLTSILPDSLTYTISSSMPLNNVPVDDYKLAVRIIQPDAEDQKINPWGLDARNTYVLFSNDLPIIDGVWDNNNALVGGWSILDTISIDSSTIVSNSEVLTSDNMRIYPNPSSDQLNMAFDQSILIKGIQVRDITGRLVKSINLKRRTDFETLDITNLPAGVYSLFIDAENSQIQTVFMKSN